MRIERNDTIFDCITRFNILPVVNTDMFPNTVEPNVLNRSVFRCSGSVVTIANFAGGSDGQELKIIGDGNTTVANNSNITTNTGADKLLAADLVYRFTYLLVTQHWYEDS